jgi:NAD(P)-dependent dehydrogenase (short-subunit alcohol dehydrogenase family)
VNDPPSPIAGHRRKGVSNMSPSGRTALVTGASRGIGKQIAIELGRRGANVVVAARTVEARKRLPGTIGETVAEIEAVGARALAVQADMASESDLARLVDSAVECFGHIDLLVNNAAATSGKAWGAPLLDLTREDWMHQYAVNLHAPYTLIRAVAPIMDAHGGGRILNLTTAGHDADSAREPTPGLPVPLAYPSSKAALDQFCISVSPQLRAMNISITNLHPGFVRTEMVDLMVDAGLDAGSAIPMDVPTRALAYLATCDDPMAYTGRVLAAEELVDQIGRG